MKFDVIVIGGGHAGCESAHASARLGSSTAMIVTDPLSLGRMSCNPAIGGPGKSQIVREIDALGGIMASVIDKSGIQFRTLNAGKGAAVRANRVQADVMVYESVMRDTIANLENLSIIKGSVVSIVAEDGKVVGVVTDGGEEISARSVVVATGTFLNGLLHTGNRQTKGGRMGEAPSDSLPSSLAKLGIKLERLKTGTPPRIDKRGIDFDKLELQNGDDPPIPFSYFTKKIERPAIPCHLTYTNQETHKIIKNAFDRSPLFSGIIKGVGPRYCPSIEDKVARFPERLSHHIFLEPVSQNSNEVYPNGISTSLPEDVQRAFVASIAGLEKAEILKFGYAVEYDYAPPTQIYPTLETKKVSGLFFAGQINGTSGYEEAGGQGLLAGVNASNKVQAEEPLILKRSNSYIGVMVDDLTTLGTNEPYRMFTSRAEHRLVMRQDNADIRLAKIGHDIGLLSEKKYNFLKEKRANIESLIKRFKGEKLHPNKETLEELKASCLPSISDNMTVGIYLKRPEVTVREGGIFGDLSGFAPDEIERAEIEIKYEGYVKRQEEWIKELEGIENIKIDSLLDYSSISGLSAELSQKLGEVKPLTFGQASRIPGITPAALSILMIHLKTRTSKK